MPRISRSHFGLALALLTLAALVGFTSRVPAPAEFTLTVLLGSAGITAISAVLPVVLPPVQLSLAHGVGLSLTFIFGPTAAAWALALGLALGEILRLIRSPMAPEAAQWQTARTRFGLALGHQVLPLLAASGLYLWLGGRFPAPTGAETGRVALGAFALTYLALFNALLVPLAGFEPELPDGYRRASLSQIIALELLPIPLAVLAAAGYPAGGPGLLLAAGALLLLAAAVWHALSHSAIQVARDLRTALAQLAAAHARLDKQALVREAGATLATTLDRRTINEALSQTLASVAGADECTLLNFDEVEGVARIVYRWARAGRPPHRPSETYALDSFPRFAHALRERTPTAMRRDDPRADPQEVARLEAAGYGSMLALPMITPEHVIGLAELYTYEARDFSEDEMRLAQSVANQAAIAIANARLFYRVAEGRDRLAAVLNSTREGVLVMEASGQVSLVNPPLERFWGISSGHLVGQNLLQLLNKPELDIAAKLGFAPDDIVELLQTLKAGLALAIPRAQYHIDRPRPRFLERTGAPVLDRYAKAIGWVIVLRDVTEEREIQQVREALSSMIVHDLRSPLNAVLASLALIRDHIPASTQSPVAAQALEIARRSIERLIGLVNTLLDISRLEQGEVSMERARVNLNQLADEVMSDMLPLAHEHGVVLINEMAPDLPALWADPEKVSRIFVNLIDNALKYTPGGGQIRVRGRRVAPENQAAGEPAVECSVADTGPGIPPEYLDRIFDRFTQVHGRVGRRPGAGLGLAFCKLAVEAHGGRIWAENLPEGGSSFHFTMPVGHE